MKRIACLAVLISSWMMTDAKAASTATQAPVPKTAEFQTSEPATMELARRGRHWGHHHHRHHWHHHHNWYRVPRYYYYYPNYYYPWNYGNYYWYRPYRGWGFSIWL